MHFKNGPEYFTRGTSVYFFDEVYTSELDFDWFGLFGFMAYQPL